MLTATILNAANLDSESPYILSCDAMVHGDPMKLNFIGDYARARSMDIKSLRTGDVAAIGGKVRGGDILIETFTLITDHPKATVGRNLSTWG